MIDGAYLRRLQRRYAPLIAEHGDSHRALDWGSERSQQVRFAVLADAVRPDETVLDVGCGLGHFADVLDRRAHRGGYLGIDALDEMVEAARMRRPDRRFERIVGGAEPFPGADVVVGSGLFTFFEREPMEATLAAMFAAARRLTAFNVLSRWSDAAEPGEFALEPSEALAIAHRLTPWVTLRHDYLPHDLTVLLYREPQA